MLMYNPRVNIHANIQYSLNIFTCVGTDKYILSSKCMYIYTFVHTHVQIYMYECIHIYVYIYVYIYIINIYIYTYIHLYIYVYIYMYMDMHMFIHDARVRLGAAPQHGDAAQGDDSLAKEPE